MKFNYSLLFLGLFFILISSCRNDDDSVFVTPQAVDLSQVSVPSATMTLGSSMLLEVEYTLNAGCEAPMGLEMKSEGNQRFLTMYKYTTEATCGAAEVQTSEITFTPKAEGTYVLNFRMSEGNTVPYTVTVTPAVVE